MIVRIYKRICFDDDCRFKSSNDGEVCRDVELPFIPFPGLGISIGRPGEFLEDTLVEVWYHPTTGKWTVQAEPVSCSVILNGRKWPSDAQRRRAVERESDFLIEECGWHRIREIFPRWEDIPYTPATPD